jgi:lipopolysaccharide transport system ATP-binding protein
MNSAIKIEHVSKLYHISQGGHGFRTFRETLMDVALAPFSRFRKGYAVAEMEDFWALQDVSLNIEPGEVVGLIGRNGSGKSTLMKILAHITTPSKGKVTLNGRVGCLLEVGTGFHPELTGRENIYLNGAILGMSRHEITKKFDEIVDFAGIPQFLDTPVKRYSSGMYVRLAFAVAAHLEPEILLVDEVLAVGDTAFQKKCLGKIDSVSKSGRTVVFVSHSMAAVHRLCERTVWMDSGKVIFDGSSNDAIKLYQSHASATVAEWQRPETHPENEDVSFASISARNSSGQVTSGFRGDEPIHVEIDYVVHRELDPCVVGARLLNSEEICIFGTEDIDGGDLPSLKKEAGAYRAAFTIPGNILVPGRYYFMVGAHSPHKKWYELIDQALVLDVSASGSLASDGRRGVISPLIRWDTSPSMSLDCQRI